MAISSGLKYSSTSYMTSFKVRRKNGIIYKEKELGIWKDNMRLFKLTKLPPFTPRSINTPPIPPSSSWWRCLFSWRWAAWNVNEMSIDIIEIYNEALGGTWSISWRGTKVRWGHGNPALHMQQRNNVWATRVAMPIPSRDQSRPWWGIESMEGSCWGWVWGSSCFSLLSSWAPSAIVHQSQISVARAIAHLIRLSCGRRTDNNWPSCQAVPLSEDREL